MACRFTYELLAYRSSGKFEVNVRLSSGEQYQCKFLVNGEWKHSDLLVGGLVSDGESLYPDPYLLVANGS